MMHVGLSIQSTLEYASNAYVHSLSHYLSNRFGTNKQNKQKNKKNEKQKKTFGSVFVFSHFRSDTGAKSNTTGIPSSPLHLGANVAPIIQQQELIHSFFFACRATCRQQMDFIVDNEDSDGEQTLLSLNITDGSIVKLGACGQILL